MVRNRCPPGVLCLSSGIINTIILVGVLLIGFFLYQTYGLQKQQQQQQQHQQHQQQPQQEQQQRNDTNIYVSRGGDDRYTRAPEPLQIFNGVGGGGLGFSTTRMPFNIPTQGFPPQFTTVGNLTTEDGQVLPLYGRRSAYNSDRYNYYTRTDTYNPVPLPIKFGKRDCMEDTGCNEVFNKDEVRISATGKEARVNIFKFDAPKYIP